MQSPSLELSRRRISAGHSEHDRNIVWKDLQTLRPLLQAMDRLVDALLQPAS